MASSKRKRSDASDYSVPPDDVSQDFKDALQDLSGNDRYQISNLTIIAKESTEHAMSISEVLLRHISKVSPTRKLPALYVLDSIVKNVGTPYTNFLSRNLFKTFMEAYTLVDPQTRKQMESMLKTWKEPVPGSMDKQPVFPVETTRPIDNALIKARTMFIEQQKQQQQQQQQQQHQQQQHQLPGFQTRPNPPHALPPRPALPGTQQWRDSPTPPQHNPYNPPPPTFYSPPPYQSAPYGAPQMLSPAHNYQSQFQPPPPQQYPDVPTPHQYLPHQPPLQTYPSHPAPQPYPPHPTPDHAPLPNNLSLAALLQASGTYPHQPPVAQAAPDPQQTPSQFAGLEALFKSRNTAEHSVPNTYDRIPTPQPPTLTSTPVQSHLFTPPVNPATLSRPPAEVKNDVQLTIASLKIRRPGLLHTLYSYRPSQCTTCGRRFPATAQGKARKSRHLDAHFRTNMKITQQEAQGGRGVSRSWYVGEVDWIGAREYDDADEPDATNAGQAVGSAAAGKGTHADGIAGGGSGSGGSAVGKGAAGWGNMAERYIKAPADAAMAKYACPICQEEFSAVWHDEAQEWVWMDAVKVGDKVYHGSCLGEMAKDRSGQGTSTMPGLGAKAKFDKVEA